ncbi:hypothetical protein TSMEX_008523 [Taenia solium]|eukprot:TsM_000988000 transcript=TsM_000988000 gene=TsM_000988000
MMRAPDVRSGYWNSAFFRIPISFEDFHFGPALPAPSIRIEPEPCPPKSGLVAFIIFVLPWDQQVYYHRFNFLSTEQRFTFAFRARLRFAGHGFDWLRLFQPIVFQFYLLLSISMLPRLLPTPVVSIKGHRFRHLPSLLLASPLLTTLTGFLVCPGGHLHAADNLQSCLLITLATTFLLGLWISLATMPFAVATAVSFK